MSDREIDALVAERVMGWVSTIERPPNAMTDWRLYPDAWYFDPSGWLCNVTQTPRYSTHITADYEVLCKVRDTWEPGMLRAFLYAIQERIAGRDRPYTTHDEFLLLNYQPGDYSRAALAALGISMEQIA